jgi:hypothetical protein
MRTTIEFDPDVAAELSRRRREGGRALREDVNLLVRLDVNLLVPLGFAHESRRSDASRPRFSTPTFDSGRPLVRWTTRWRSRAGRGRGSPLILVDANLVASAVHVQFDAHAGAKEWLDDRLNGAERVGLP